MSQSAIITVIERACRKAAPRLRRDFGEVAQLQVSKKGPSDFVSQADRACEQTLVEELRKARRYMISGRINRGADVVVPGPYGMATVIRGHDFYAEKFWNAGRYQEWVDEVWTDPPRENVDVGAPITIGAE